MGSSPIRGSKKKNSHKASRIHFHRNSVINCVIDNIIFSIQRSGGISILWRNIIKRLACDKRFNTSFIEYDNALENIFRVSFMLNPDSIIRNHSSRLITLSRYTNLNNKINKPYIFHSTYYRTDRNKNAINITTVHDFIYEKFAPAIKREIHRSQKWNAIRNSDAIICISESTKRDLLQYIPEVDENKIFVVHNGVDSDFRILNPQKRYYEIPFPSKEYVLFVGSRDKNYKNFDLAVEACAQANLPLILTSGGPLKKYERNLLDSKLGKSAYLKTGIIETKTLNELYNNALALVYPSKYEGFGLPIIEAQKAGCPVIAFNDSSIPEIMGTGGIALNDMTATGIVKALNFIYDNPDQTKQMIQRGLKNAERFSWEKNYRCTTAVYNTVWNERTGGGGGRIST